MNELKGDLPEGFKMTELGPLPEEWEVVRLGDVAEISSGGSAPQGDEYFKGSKPFVRVSHIDNEDCVIKEYDLINDKAVQDYRLKLFPKGTIVFPKSGATIYLEKRAMLPIDAYVVSHLCTVLSKREDLSQCFLFYVLRNLKFAKEKADGYPTLNISEIKQIIFPLPPLPEQRKIAAILSAIQEAKEKTEAVISATRELKKSMMNYLFTYGPVSVVDAENVPLKETEVGMVPEEWEVVRLGECLDLLRNGITEKQDKAGRGLPVSRIETISTGKINVQKVGYILGLSNDEIERYKLQEGDVLFSHINSEPYLGNSAIYENNPKVLIHGMNLLLFRTKASMLDSKFLNFLFNYYRQKRVFLQIASRSVNQSSINQGKIKTLLIPLPPLPTQQKIASMLSAIDEKIEAEENKKKALEDLFKTLLHNLMTAKIRVNSLEVGV